MTWMLYCALCNCYVRPIDAHKHWPVHKLTPDA